MSVQSDMIKMDDMILQLKDSIKKHSKIPNYIYEGVIETKRFIGHLPLCNKTRMKPCDRPLYKLSSNDEMRKIMDIMDVLPEHHFFKLLSSNNIIESMCSHYKTSRDSYMDNGGHIRSINHEMMLWACELMVTRNDTIKMVSEYFHEWNEKRKVRTDKEFLKENEKSLRDGDVLFRNNIRDPRDSILVKMYFKNLNNTREIYDRRHNKTNEQKKPTQSPETASKSLSAGEWKKLKDRAGRLGLFNTMIPTVVRMLKGDRPSPKHLNLYEGLYYTTKHHMKHSPYFKNNLVVTSLAFMKHIWGHPEHWRLLRKLKNELYYQKTYYPFMKSIGHGIAMLKNYIAQYDKRVINKPKPKTWHESVTLYYNRGTHFSEFTKQHNYFYTKRYMIDRLNRLYYNRRLARYESLDGTFFKPEWKSKHYDVDSHFSHMEYVDMSHIQFKDYLRNIEQWGGLIDPSDRGFDLTSLGDLFNGTIYLVSWVFRTGRFNESNCNPGIAYLPDPADGCLYPIFGLSSLPLKWVSFLLCVSNYLNSPKDSIH